MLQGTGATDDRTAAGPEARLHGPGARAGDHDQGGGGLGGAHLEGAGLRAELHRHPRARGLPLRSQPGARGVRGRLPDRRRHPGRGGPDRGEPLQGRRREPGADPGHQQDRPALRRARAAGDAGRGRAGPARRGLHPHLRQERAGRGGAADAICELPRPQGDIEVRGKRSTSTPSTTTTAAWSSASGSRTAG